MIQGISAADERFLLAMGQIDQRAAKAERELSSGRRLNVASDAPDQVGAALSVRAQLEQTLQIQTNLSQVQTEVDTSEQSVSSAIQILERMNTVGAQGATETVKPAQRQSIAIEVDSLLRSLVALANTSVQGRYVFSGDTDQVPPYSIDTDGNVSPYAGSASTREVMHPNGTTFPISRTAEDIFDAPGASTFAAASALKTALENGPTVPEDDPAYPAQYHAQSDQISAALSDLSNAMDYVNQQLAFYGVAQNRISDATNYSHSLELSLRQQLSALQDADITSAALELTQATTQRQAALSARAKLPTSSLFDYLG
jgi:flagellar hook-associated protein 3 FlgL